VHSLGSDEPEANAATARTFDLAGGRQEQEAWLGWRGRRGQPWPPRQVPLCICHRHDEFVAVEALRWVALRLQACCDSVDEVIPWAASGTGVAPVPISVLKASPEEEEGHRAPGCCCSLMPWLVIGRRRLKSRVHLSVREGESTMRVTMNDTGSIRQFSKSHSCFTKRLFSIATAHNSFFHSYSPTKHTCQG
jgi:hypothetical protein